MKTDRHRRDIVFYKLVREHSKGVYFQALGILGDAKDAEEATQDVFLRVHRGLKRYRRESSLATWIYRIALNICISRRRKPERPEIPFEHLQFAEAAASEEENPERRYIERETSHRLAGLMSALSEKEVQALTLFYYDDLSYEEISDIMNVPMGSVATILHRARTRLHVHFLLQEKERV